MSKMGRMKEGRRGKERKKGEKESSMEGGGC